MKIKKLLRRIVLTVTLLMLGFISFLLYQSKDDINADLTNIEKKLNSYYNPNKMGGFAVSIFNTDSIIYSQGFGYSNKLEKNPYTISTQQFIASISKTTIGVALMKAEELNLLGIDDPINKHLPFKIHNPNFPKDEITIKQLATHTSSLDYNELVIESLYIEEAQKSKSLSSFMNDYFKQGKYGEVKFTKFKPGSDWNYSNIGASLAAYIIEIVSGTSFSDFTQIHIFNPLKLNNTYWKESESDSSAYTKYYEPVKDSIISVQTSGVMLYPSRDVITDVIDLTKYCQAIISKNSSLLNSDSFNKLLSPQLDNSVTNREDDNNGIFFMIDRNNYGITYQLTGMSGGDNCISTMMWFDPKTKLGYIFIGNTGTTKLNSSNHNWIYNALVSLGYNYTYENSTVSEKARLKWHNIYNRIRAFF